MLRPVTKTRRPLRAAASITCWTREISEAKVATITRPGAVVMMWSSASPDDLLGGRVARHLGVGRVGQEQQHALVAQLGEAGQVGRAGP